jgi:selenocysteine-specific elongation factor
MTTSTEVPQRSIVVGTAGHIDHGKTMLVRALTGIDTDRLPEEKRRGITVDLGFATFDLQTATGVRVRLDIIDVPGHKQFVRNMLAGAGGIDAVMLVISAQEGVMPQTEEHLVICGLLGIKRGLTVLTKCDLVPEDELGAVCERVRATLEPSFLRKAPIVPVSAQTGFGMASLRKELARLSERVPERSFSGLPRLPLDRSFVIKGFGTVVTGTLQSGSLRGGQSLTLEPGGKEVRVRGLQRQGRSHGEAFAGSRVALNLSGVEAAEVSRGATLVLPRTLHAVELIDAEVLLLPNAPELPHRARVRLHSFTSETIATVSVYGYRAVPAGAIQIVRLRLANPVLLVPGDRFVLRRLSPAQTIGGGRVLDAHPAPRTPRKITLAWLEQIRGASPSQELELRVERRGAAGIIVAQLAEEMGWTAEVIRTTVHPMLANGSMRLLSHQLLVSQVALKRAGEGILSLLAASLGSGTMRSVAIRRSVLRSQSHLASEVFDAVLEILAEERSLAVGSEAGHELVHLPGANIHASDPNREQLANLAEIYRRAGLNPPAFSEAMRELRFTEKDARSYVTSLLRDKTLVKIAVTDIFMHREAVEALEKRIRDLKDQTLDVGRLKQITGLSRKYAIPLLEYLDRQRITRRQGDTRIVL